MCDFSNLKIMNQAWIVAFLQTALRAIEGRLIDWISPGFNVQHSRKLLLDQETALSVLLINTS